MEGDSTTRYTPDEVQAIVRRALRMEDPAGSISGEELEEIARQSGISPERLRQALKEEATERERLAAREKVRAKKRREFRDHFRSYLITNGFLVIVNFLTTSYPWSLWVLLCWGIGLAFHACEVFWPNEEETEKEAEKLLKVNIELRAGNQGTAHSGEETAAQRG